MAASLRCSHPSIHPCMALHKFLPATENVLECKSMRTKRFKIYVGECTRLTSIHPSIRGSPKIPSRRKTFPWASASTIMISNLFCGECTPAHIHPSIQFCSQIPSRRKSLSEVNVRHSHPSKALHEFFPTEFLYEGKCACRHETSKHYVGECHIC